MISEGRRTQVWYGLHESARLHRYYKLVTDYNHRWHFCVGFVLGCITVAAATVLLADAGPTRYISGALFFLGAALILWMAGQQYERRTAIAEIATREYRRMNQGWYTLWTMQSEIDDAEVATAVTELRLREALLETATEGLPTYDRYNKSAGESATTWIESLPISLGCDGGGRDGGGCGTGVAGGGELLVISPGRLGGGCGGLGRGPGGGGCAGLSRVSRHKFMIASGLDCKTLKIVP